MASCSSNGESATSTTAVPTTTISPAECEAAADQAIAPLQAFIDQYDEMTPEEWNALDPPADAQPAQDEMISIAQAAVDQGCDPTEMESMLSDRVAALSGVGEVGQAIAAALRGDGPILGPPLPAPATTVPRDAEASTQTLGPDDDLRAVLDTVAPGSTITLEAGTYEFENPIVVSVDVTIVGAGTDQTIISSSAEGVAMTFVGPGGLAIEDLTIEHVGDLEASVLLAIEGPLRLTRTELRGAVAGADQAGGGHGLVFAFDQLPGFPERTDAERAGPLLVEDSTIVDNAAAGILLTGKASPTVRGSYIAHNGGCGICYTSSSGGLVSETVVAGNDIGVQVGDDSTPTIRSSSVVDSTSAGISVDGNSTTTVDETEIETNAGVGIQATGSSTITASASTFASQNVGVLVAGEATVEVSDSDFSDHDIGVQVGGDATVQTLRNTLATSASAAISYGESGGGLIEGNQVTESEQVGIQVIGDATPDVRGNTVSTAGGVGISVVDQGVSTVADNEVHDRQVGIQVGGTAQATVTGNSVFDCVAVGVLFGDQATGSATGNEITCPEAVGMLAGGDSAPLFEDNLVTGNGVGIVFREQSAGQARLNTVRDHQIGMQIVDAATPFVYKNTIESSTDAGIAVAGTSTARIEQNQMADNGNISIQIAESSQPSILGNVMRGKTVYGLLFRDSGGGEARDNRVINHVYGIQVNDSATPALIGNSLEQIALTSIAYAGSSGGTATSNHCTQSFSAGISISDNANPQLSDNDCSVSSAA